MTLDSLTLTPEFWLARARSATDHRETLGPQAGVSVIRELLARRSIRFALARRLGDWPELGTRLPHPGTAERQLARLILDAVARERLFVVRVRRLVSNGGPGLPVVPPSQPPSAKPVVEKTWFWVELLDDVSVPLPGIPLRIDAGNTTRVIITNAQGVVELHGVEAGIAQVEVADFAALEAALEARWIAPRDEALKTGSHVHRAELDHDLRVDIDDRVNNTIHVLPRFHCCSIDGAHFAFGRSFVRDSAFPALGEIARELDKVTKRRAMIFGHTDRSGPDSLNKELSERRARVIHTLLTHDTEAWRQMWHGLGGVLWHEKWGDFETRAMLRALECHPNDGIPLSDESAPDPRTPEALERFQAGDYPRCPPEQAPLPQTGVLDDATLAELFLAYAKIVSRNPIPADRFAKINGSPFMGCGEFNPITDAPKDLASRRTNIFVFHPVAEPQGLPCQIGTVQPCYAVPLLPIAPAEGPPFRCPEFIKVASGCPCNGGFEQSHDLLVRIRLPFSEVTQLPDTLILESEDGTVQQSKSLASDSRSVSDGTGEVFFADLPETLRYKMTSSSPDGSALVFPLTPYEQLSELGAAVTTSIAPTVVPFLDEELLPGGGEAGGEA